MMHRVVERYETRLQAIRSPILRDPQIRRVCADHAARVLRNCEESLRLGRVVHDDVPDFEPRPHGHVAELSPEDHVRAGSELAAVICEHLMARTGLAALPAVVAQTLAEGVAASTQRMTRWGQPLRVAADPSESQRQWLAREIHDWFGNAVGLALRRLDLYDIHRDSGDSLAADAEIVVVRRALDDVLEATRVLVSGLRRGIPEGRLVDALCTYVRDAEPHGALVEVDVLGDEELLPPDLRVELFVMVREGLRNALAHSRATNIVARIDIKDEVAIATVEDNGIGVRSGAVNDPASAGISSMRERAGLLGAEFRLTRMPVSGTRLFLSLPIPVVSDARAS